MTSSLLSSCDFSLIYMGLEELQTVFYGTRKQIFLEWNLAVSHSALI